MIRKWIVFALSAGLLIALGVVVPLSQAEDEPETELGKIMEQVQKHHLLITKGVRSPANFKKAQKDLGKSAKELVKLAKKAKPIKDALAKAKDEKDPQKKWNDFMDDLVKNSEKFEKVVAKPGTTGPQAKDSYKSVAKNCTDCHAVFRVDSDSF